ncbi:hypothetical protein G9C98_005222 [Cotesia typhae]|uniref:BAT2 N-terminal domain-containing protein n=1 Tax=Cotesia typhae TaxID=2053667 RepID=A0A8J5VCZ6_9HYME|nr:hypothetical protein G9C98_005222 [Cotesia typhae]
MSTLSGIVSKGEKGKSKFQSLDINSLYRVSRGESLEQHQQKSTLPRKHGMQSLGKVPSARRPPANLPSLKSEYSSSDPAVSLVPSGGSGWATTKEQSPNTNTTTTTNATAAPLSDTTTNSSLQCAPATTSVQSPAVGTAAPPSSQQQQPQSLPSQQQQQNTQSQSQHSSEQTANKSSWSAIMSRPGDAGTPAVSAAVGYAGLVGGGRPGRGALGLSFLAHQSPQFQHEFPSLSGQPSVSVPTNNTNQQTTTQQSSSSTASNVISVNAQHQSLLPQQQYPHNHSGGMLVAMYRRELDPRWKSHTRSRSWYRRWEYSGGPGPPSRLIRNARTLRRIRWRTSELGTVACHGFGPGRPTESRRRSVLECKSNSSSSWPKFTSLSWTYSPIYVQSRKLSSEWWFSSTNTVEYERWRRRRWPPSTVQSK